jgi:hypothetical protein
MFTNKSEANKTNSNIRISAEKKLCLDYTKEQTHEK